MRKKDLLTFFCAIGAAILFSSHVAAQSDEYEISEEEVHKLVKLHNCLSKADAGAKYINWQLQESARNGQQAVVGMMLDHTIGLIMINQDGVNGALRAAAINCQLGIIALLLENDKDKKQIRPNQFGINRAFCDVVAAGLHVSVAEKLLSLPEAEGRPDQKSINLAYNDAAAYKHQSMITLLNPYLVSKSDNA